MMFVAGAAAAAIEVEAAIGLDDVPHAELLEHPLIIILNLTYDACLNVMTTVSIIQLFNWTTFTVPHHAQPSD